MVQAIEDMGKLDSYPPRLSIRENRQMVMKGIDYLTGRKAMHVAVCLANQWISNSQAGKTAKVPVGGPQLAHSVLLTYRYDPCIMHLGTRDAPAQEGCSQQQALVC